MQSKGERFILRPIVDCSHTPSHSLLSVSMDKLSIQNDHEGNRGTSREQCSRCSYLWPSLFTDARSRVLDKMDEILSAPREGIKENGPAYGRLKLSWKAVYLLLCSCGCVSTNKSSISKTDYKEGAEGNYVLSRSLREGMEGRKRKKSMRWPGVEPGSTAWKATMLTVTPPTPYWSQKRNSSCHPMCPICTAYLYPSTLHFASSHYRCMRSCAHGEACK